MNFELTENLIITLQYLKILDSVSPALTTCNVF